MSARHRGAAADRQGLGEVPGHRRQRHRRSRADTKSARRCGRRTRCSRTSSRSCSATTCTARSGRRTSWRSSSGRTSRCSTPNPVLCGARQSRRSEPALLQELQHGRQALLHLSEEGRRASSRSTATTWTRTSSAGSRTSCRSRTRNGRSPTSIIRSIRPGGRHGSEVDLRAIVEPLFIKYSLNVVFAGHEHFYERLKPQKGINYFTAGGSAKLRAGDIVEQLGDDREGLRHRAELHARRDRRRRDALPDHLAPRQAHRLR